MDSLIDTYTTFGSFYDRMLADVNAARQRVYVQFFKYEPDALGQQLGVALTRRAKEGVDVRFLYDDFVCHRWRWYYRHLRSQGVSVAGYAPIHKPLPRLCDYYRNHRKIVSIDDTIAYTGGMNIAERYHHGLEWGCWRDTMIRIEGPSALQLRDCFLHDWDTSTHPRRPNERAHPSQNATKADASIQVITSDPNLHDRSIMLHTVALLNEAERYVWFESPYFIPTREVMVAMCRAARRGVDVRVLQPPRGDRGEATQWASKHHYGQALDAGVKIGVYHPGFLHSKIIVSDDRIGVVSSCNIDPRSYCLCQEVATVVDDAAFAASLRDVFLTDERQSTYIDPDQWHHRPKWQRLKENICNIISSQM
ncbi:MAG: hypothetical protein K6E96_00010 [Bacteroidales bacterium]|nr:hypothetical protein [Bacteroidales bacterium]